MNKEWRNMLLFLGFIAVISLIFIYEPEENVSSDEYVYTPNIENISKNTQTVEDQFPNIKELHWGHMPLTYKITNPLECKEWEVMRMKQSFKILTNLTNSKILFTESSDASKADVYLTCTQFSEKYNEEYCYYHYFKYNKTLFYDFPDLSNKTFICSNWV